MSAIKDFTLNLSEIRFVGNNLSGPESVLASPDGTLWISDNRGLVTRIHPDGTQTLLGDVGREPSGLAMDRSGNIYITNVGDGKLYKLYPDGNYEVILREIDGKPLGAVNYVFIDSRDRLWISIATLNPSWQEAVAKPRPDGYIILLDEKGYRMVADGIYFTNEIRLDAREEYLYVAETMGCRMLRYKVQGDGCLGESEVFGPDNLGFCGFVDGFAFDAEGNIWLTLPVRNSLAILTAGGDYHVVFEEVNQPALENFVAKVEAGILDRENLIACAGKTLQLLAGVTFAGKDLQTVYLGSLEMPHLVTFKSPIPGLPMRHWR
ncbi:MAG: SMP-30/gluconolactonase/LRE family protein [Hormoscilla sp.]